MDSLYTDDIAKLIRSFPKPYDDLIVHVSEFPDTRQLAIQVYEHDIVTRPEIERMRIGLYLRDVCEAVNSAGIECFVQGVKGNASKR